MTATRSENLDRMAACWQAARDLGCRIRDEDSGSLLLETLHGAVVLSATDDEVGFRLSLQELVSSSRVREGFVLIPTGSVDCSNLTVAQFVAVLTALVSVV